MKKEIVEYLGFEDNSKNPVGRPKLADKETKRKYGRSWKKIRKRYVASHPFCEECLKKGILVPVDEVHHIIPLAERGTHDEDNLMSLCKTCHAKIHGSRGDYKESKSFQVYDYEK